MGMHTGPQQLLHEIHSVFASDRWLVFDSCNRFHARTTINSDRLLCLCLSLSVQSCSSFRKKKEVLRLDFIIRMEIVSCCVGVVGGVVFIHRYDAIAICCRYIDLLQNIYSIDLAYCCYIFFAPSLVRYFIFFFFLYSLHLSLVVHLFFHFPYNWFSIIIALNGRFFFFSWYTKYKK